MAATDIVTLTEARDYLTANRLADSPLLSNWITAASATIDDLAGPVVNRTITAELHSGGTSEIRLRFSPVSSITTVTEYATDGSSTALTAETVSSKPAAGYLADLTRGVVWRRAAGLDYPFAGNRRSVSVTYVAGRAASTSAVPYRFKQACLMTLAHLWRVEHGTGNSFGEVATTPSGFAIPNRVIEVLGSEAQPSRSMGIA
jgi:uncharacterized phiE125 gp8 family phage protein